MKIYRGKRIGEGKLDTGSDVVVTVSEDKEIDKNLEHHVYHSPTGFNWGYLGSGPSDLACSILWDFLGKEPGRELYMSFKGRFVAEMGDEWEVDSDDIKEWIIERYGKHYYNYLTSTGLSDPRD